ncbi:MAG TPA: hypothetical protein VI819_03125 [Patescibacteria group bacterium]|nr:hypothetical protein [Patescibacteria group bacterium]
MDTTILQIPIRKSLRDRATVTAKNMGFSSLQETVRVFLNKLALGKVDITFNEPTVLSAKAVKRYDKMIKDIESGKEVVYRARNVDDLMDYLHGKKDPVQSNVS